MMISPETFVELRKDMTFDELIKERKRLLADIIKLESMVFDENRSGEAWMIKPGPDAQYQMDLEYLAELCTFMQQKYNVEYEDGEWEDFE